MNDRKVKFLITVDVETYYVNDRILPFEINIHGDIKNTEYGVSRIMQICDDFNVKSTFFVDVYEHYKFGDEALKDVCQNINDKGHSVQLHAHVNFMPGLKQEFIKCYDLQTQDTIISEGKELIKKWIGKDPVAFRGGAYGVNLDTIRALETNKFLIDSSFFINHKNCDLNKELANKFSNAPFMINKVLEIPVTVYNFINLPFWKKNSKIDLNACSFFELRSAIEKIIEDNKLDLVVVFLHSFSFIRWDNNYKNVSVDFKTMDNFVALLEFITNNYGEIVSFLKIEELKDYIAGYTKNDYAKDYIPKLSIFSILPRYLKRLNF